MKKNLVKLLGGLGCLFFILGLLIVVAIWFMRDKETVSSSADSSTTQSTSTEETARRSDVNHYVNTSDGRSGELAAGYVGFEFDWPQNWVMKDQTADSTNYVAVERQFKEQTWESFTVGYFKTAGTKDGNEQLYAQLIDQLRKQFGQQFTNLQDVREGKTTVGDYEGYEGLFQATVDADGTPVQVFIRTILLPTPDAEKGVTLLMLGTSYHPELSGPGDLGEKGEMPIALSSFRFTS